jgi:hypothetical protein
VKCKWEYLLIYLRHTWPHQQGWTPLNSYRHVSAHLAGTAVNSHCSVWHRRLSPLGRKGRRFSRTRCLWCCCWARPEKNKMMSKYVFKLLWHFYNLSLNCKK